MLWMFRDVNPVSSVINTEYYRVGYCSNFLIYNIIFELLVCRWKSGDSFNYVHHIANYNEANFTELTPYAGIMHSYLVRRNVPLDPKMKCSWTLCEVKSLTSWSWWSCRSISATFEEDSKKIWSEISSNWSVTKQF